MYSFSVLNITKLLIDAGADIDQCDNNGFSPLMILINNLQPQYRSVDLNLSQINQYKYIIKHVAKLKAAVNYQQNSSFLDIIPDQNNASNFFTECIQELEKARKTKLNNSSVTFFDLIVDGEEKLIKYAGNEGVTKDCMQTNLAERFPNYGPMMQENMSKGINGRKAFDTAAVILSQHLSVDNPDHLIIRKILDRLSVEDWKNLSIC